MTIESQKEYALRQVLYDAVLAYIHSLNKALIIMHADLERQEQPS